MLWGFHDWGVDGDGEQRLHPAALPAEEEVKLPAVNIKWLLLFLLTCEIEFIY